MSHSHKKISSDQIPLVSITQKLRSKAAKSHFHRQCCEKQNNNGKESRQSIGKDPSHSTRKGKKKKFLEEEFQKMLQRRQLEEEHKMSKFKQHNTNQLQGLRGDLKEMKDVIYKLSSKEVSFKNDIKDQQVLSKQDYQLICGNYLRKMEELKSELSVQRQLNSKLEQAHIQSQLFAKQTKDYSESINKELTELASKHIHCENNIKALQQQKETVRCLEDQVRQLTEKLKTYQFQKEVLTAKTNKLITECTNVYNQKNNAERELTVYKQENDKIKQQNTTLLNENRRLIDIEKKNEQQIKFKIDKSQESLNTVKQLTQINDNISQKLTYLKEKLENKTKQLKQIQQFNQQLLNEKTKLDTQLKKLQTQFNNTKVDLGNTKQKLGGLTSMEKKCEQLFQQIKMEKQRWDKFNGETTQQRQTLQQKLTKVQYEKQQLMEKINSIQKQKKQLYDMIEKLKTENKKVCDDKVKLSKQIRELEDQIDSLEQQKQSFSRQKETIIIKSEQYKSTIKQKDLDWQRQKKKLQTKLEWLEKQKIQIELEVNGTLQVAKKRNDQIQTLNRGYQIQINQLKEQNNKLEITHNKLQEQCNEFLTQNQLYKTVVKAKEQTIIQLQSKITQNKENLQNILEKNKQTENKQKLLILQWSNKCQSIHIKLETCLNELRECKSMNNRLQNQLITRDERITGLSSLRQNLELKIVGIQSRLNESQAIRLTLSSDMSDYHNTTRRNEQAYMEERSIFGNELTIKNKLIYQLKQTIKLVKEQSLRIQQQMHQYKRIGELQELVHSQISHIQSSLKYLTKQKEQLEFQINVLKAQNFDLSNKIFQMESQYLLWPNAQIEYLSKIKLLQYQKEEILLKIRQEQGRMMELKQNQRQQLDLKQKEINQIRSKLQSQRTCHSINLIESQSSINQVRSSLHNTTKNYQKLLNDIKEKDTTIRELNEKLKLFEQKRRKAINQVHGIQNQISEIGLKNSMLEEDLHSRDQMLKLAQDKIKIILQANVALEQQSKALNEQSAMLKEEIAKMRQKNIKNEEKAQMKINEVYEICEARKNEAVNALKQKIKELANELACCINKLQAKNKEIEENEVKCIKLQEVLEENHQLLTQQRKQRQQAITNNTQLNIQIQSYKYQINSKDRQLQAFNRDKTIFREKMVEQQSKYEILKRKFQYLHQQKSHAQRQIENQNLSLRVIKEQNRNIQKVMTDQINQRKVIIEQLVNEKRMLYSQLHHER